MQETQKKLQRPEWEKAGMDPIEGGGTTGTKISSMSLLKRARFKPGVNTSTRVASKQL